MGIEYWDLWECLLVAQLLAGAVSSSLYSTGCVVDIRM